MTRTRIPLRAAIYTRISEDRYGEADGVDRQRESCEKLAVDRDLSVVAYFEDNDKSAMHGARPAYEEMLEAVRRGEIDVILVKRTDRLYRRLVELLPLTEVLKAWSVPVFSVNSGDVDLSTADGRLRANIMGAVAQHSSEVQGERVADAAVQRAQRGRFSGGPRRFGYRHAEIVTRRVRDRKTGEYSERECPTGPLILVPDEADAIAWAYAQVARGGTLESVTREWRRRGLAGPNGADFTGVMVRDVLLRPTNAGIVNYKGQEMHDVVAEAPAIVERDVWRTVSALLRDPTRRTGSGRPALTLLAPVLRCAVCDGKMKGAHRWRRTGDVDAIYRCSTVTDKGAGRTGGHVTRMREKLDAAVERLLVGHLVENQDRLRRPVGGGNGAVAEAARRAEELRAKLAGFQSMVVDMDPADYAIATKKIRTELSVLDARITVAVGSPRTAELVRSADIELDWVTMPVDERRTVVVENIQCIKVGHGTPGTGDRTMQNVEIIWHDIND